MEGLSLGSVRLPRSKSESNRALMIAAYGGFLFETENGERGTEGKLLKDVFAQQRVFPSMASASWSIPAQFSRSAHSFLQSIHDAIK